ncbi:MAG TPA: sigma-70 family RNA polymerase sigma factor, partial [Nocardioidaceae bacterium]|nr:sigma-70 family RNA polymerase sigma factor [Nocardioidaceae bacterium]
MTIAAASALEPDIDVETLVREHIPLVGHAVRQMLSRVPAHVNRDDLSSAGLTALFQAARSFDPARGVAFPGYATTRIRGALLDELRGADWASRSVRRRARQVEDVRSTLTSTLGRAPTDAEVAGALGVSVAELEANEGDVSRAVVMSLQGFGDTDVDDLLPTSAPGPAELLEHRERLAYLRDAIDQLPERNRIVVQSYFLAERPMAEVAA